MWGQGGVSARHPPYCDVCAQARRGGGREGRGGDLAARGGGGPEETMFYSLVEGRGELIMFGGIQGDVMNMQRAMSQSKNVTSAVYYLSPYTASDHLKNT